MRLPEAFTVPPDGEPIAEWGERQKERIDGRPVVLSVSGGKDSTATGLLLKAAGIPFTCVHMNTGWEHPDTEHYVREVLPGVLGPIEILANPKYPGGMVDLVRSKGMFPSRVRRFCTQQLKVFPFKAYLDTFTDDEPINAIGIRAAESKARSKFPEWGENGGLDCEVWRPILTWTYDDVIGIHQYFGVKPNPLYLKAGQSRVGCWPCIFARKAEVRAVADLTPDRIDAIDALEVEVHAAYLARTADPSKRANVNPKTGEPYTREHYGWFQNPYRRAGPNGYNQHLPASMPIRDVVKWSRTARGGKQAELFAPRYEDDGCMRWGMCDTGQPDAPDETPTTGQPDAPDETPTT